ncbi:GntR family transcriptional regulator [Aldersonia sp. NBC_00410]|uniref:GntR family transcriptional regulator n=1 Tax=Aldersonia sp. NBC_00410 TaxID=2975954 RepID=UPI00224F5863|nr:GntR family transcriptional regulator [Aldersonia sp. NBC_00410]MCX5045429.1 GntR family transcriptional regulator [Aldersonia sp. NBC_00410]
MPSPSGTAARPQRRPRLSDVAADHVRELIVSGQLAPGEFVRPEILADDLGISATPAREGLLTLQSEGFLRVEPRRGFVVAALSTADIADVYTAQALLGGELAARAAAKATDAEVVELEKIQSDLESAAKVQDFEAVERLNHEFHRRVYLMADAPKLRWLVRATLGYAPRKFFAAVEGWPEASAHDHRAIIDRLRANDGRGAREAMAQHVHNAGDLLAEHLGARSVEK